VLLTLPVSGFNVVADRLYIINSDEMVAFKHTEALFPSPTYNHDVTIAMTSFIRVK